MVLEQAGRHQDAAYSDDFRVVHLEYVDGRPANGRAADQRTALEAEVICPLVPSRMVKPRELAGRRVQPAQVRPLEGIAEDTNRLHPKFYLVDPQRRSR